MKNILLACLVILLSACQQPTVYVYTQALSTNQKQQLETKLAAQTLPYQYQNIVVPKAYKNATLVVSYKDFNSGQLEQLTLIMQSMGFEPDIIYSKAENHHYTNGNIGFYLRSASQSTELSMPSMPSIMLTTGCLNDKYNNMRVSFDEKKTQFTLPTGVKVMLDWELFEPYLVIHYQNTSQSYTHTTPKISTPFGQKPSDTFIYNAYLNKPDWLNCSLQIVYMD
ncbi:MULTISPECIES: hypothetical protein [Pseudoalteromonas]|uniref:hypothetical protein n=1 Tax=Pseudoalteromonas TaxID=53246 RepID=UPI0003F704BE|nr:MULTISPECIES: hypothetical protein [Pseudoalteromonas]PKG64379.1 hypothetical protein CXF75_10985 [Pseudoalteromonas arctica]PKG70848.1 hypothetical protein CXF64_09020 [Pseudoalteromonas sp. GutCa3]